MALLMLASHLGMRYGPTIIFREPPTLRVRTPDTPVVGDHISALPGCDGHGLWYWSSLGVMLAPVSEPERAAELVAEALAAPWEFLRRARG
ncbi:hypothetical protein [Actinomadura parmotrematis]|uniref:Uncharacterized protein n=1 Tax=Actinomadura parmotrematis TaxID=2864039 RepID=A0ABS7FWG9_9ACTN|nr:hypothetical protein [Actinomadura parmotrematis]MBW8484772.1 hypothetical protein [Actinomadura parmotrematis]